ncbi:MAG: SDR family oxidoreductase [Archangiaceae bacterium]|nr:SDR family oxidoreductase [Archangiaceae bacterium]
MATQPRLVLITGSTAGIGRRAALELARQGWQVIVQGRDGKKAERVANELKQESGNPKIDFLVADLSSMSAVRGLAAEVKQRYGRLDVLLNNAGAVNLKREVTADGYERTFATNHLAYFLLTNLLLPELQKGDRPRVVSVSSAAHRSGRLNFDDLMADKGYVGWLQYGRSKLANILFTRELARRTQPLGITANCLHPGFVASDFLSKGGLWTVIKPLAYLFAIDETQGAKTSIFLASSPEVEGVTGQYFVKCRPAAPKKFAEDDEAARRLWEASEKLTGLAATSKAA